MVLQKGNVTKRKSTSVFNGEDKCEKEFHIIVMEGCAESGSDVGILDKELSAKKVVIYAELSGIIDSVHLWLRVTTYAGSSTVR